MACKLEYIEKIFSTSNPEVAEKLNTLHLEVLRSLIASGDYIVKDNKLSKTTPSDLYKGIKVEVFEDIENKEGKKVDSLEMYASKINAVPVAEKVFTNVVGQDSLTRFDKAKKKNRNKKRRNNKSKNNKSNATQSENRNKNQIY